MKCVVVEAQLPQDLVWTLKNKIHSISVGLGRKYTHVHGMLQAYVILPKNSSHKIRIYIHSPYNALHSTTPLSMCGMYSVYRAKCSTAINSTIIRCFLCVTITGYRLYIEQHRLYIAAEAIYSSKTISTDIILVYTSVY